MHVESDTDYVCLHIRNTQCMMGYPLGVEHGCSVAATRSMARRMRYGEQSTRVCILGMHIEVGRTAHRGVPGVVRIMCAASRARFEASCRQPGVDMNPRAKKLLQK